MRDRLRTVAHGRPSDVVARAAADDIPERPPGWTRPRPEHRPLPRQPHRVGRPALASASPRRSRVGAGRAPTAEPSRASSSVLRPCGVDRSDIAALRRRRRRWPVGAGHRPFSLRARPSRATSPRGHRAVSRRVRAKGPGHLLIGLCSADCPRYRRATGRTERQAAHERHFSALDGIRYDLTGLEVAAAGPEQFVATARFQIPRDTRPDVPVSWTPPDRCDGSSTAGESGATPDHGHRLRAGASG